MSQFETITIQPNFPNEDLNEQNVPMMEYYLQQMHEAHTHAQFLKETMRPLHLTAHHALQLCGVEVEYHPKEYEAFCEGFAAFEYMSIMVNPRSDRERLMARNAQFLLTLEHIIPENKMAIRRQAWIEKYPNITTVVTGNKVAQDETLLQLHSRAIGAQIACELQMAS